MKIPTIEADPSPPDGYLGPHDIAEYIPFWLAVPIGRYVLAGCSDDRKLTGESFAALKTRYPGVFMPYATHLSTFGGAAGMVSTLAIAGTAEYGPAFLEEIGGYKALLGDVSAFGTEEAKSPEVITSVPLLHSAKDTENSATIVCPHGAKPVGCAFCANKGAITTSLVRAPLVRSTGQENQLYVHGKYADDWLMNAVEAVSDYERSLATDTEDFSIGRDTYSTYGQTDTDPAAPAMILAGVHAEYAPYIASYKQRQIGSAALAMAAKKPVYRGDIAPTTALLAHKYRLNPEIVARTLLLEATAVRGKLGKGDPRTVPMGILGNPQEAIADIRESLRRFR